MPQRTKIEILLEEYNELSDDEKKIVTDYLQSCRQINSLSTMSLKQNCKSKGAKILTRRPKVGRLLILFSILLLVASASLIAFAEPIRVAFVNTITGNGGVQHTVSAKTDLSGLLLPAALSGYETSASRTGQSCYIEYTAEDGAQYAYSVKAGNAIDDIDGDYTNVENTTLFGREAVLFTNDEQAAGVVCMPSANFVATLVGGSSYDEIVQIAKTISIK